VLADALRARGIPVQPQFGGLDLPDGSRVRLDLAVPAARWGIEIDVHPDHLLLDGTTYDKRRDRKCHRIGWQIERVTEIDLLDLDGLLDELAELYAVRIDAAA
jgi:very-short-patch-repair endonuclease